MRLLVIGGTRFVGRHIAAAAIERGHALTLFNRGLSAGPELFPDAEHIRGDRHAGGLAALAGRRFDAIVDSSAHFPADVSAAATVAADRYVFISSGSVYREPVSAGSDESAPVIELSGAAPETIASAEDYGGSVLAAEPDQPVQFIDARDLGAFCITLLEAGTTGVFNAVGPSEPLTMAGLLRACVEASGSDASIVWAGDRFLLDHGVEPWSDLPLWLPSDLAGFVSADTSRAHAAGLRTCPVGDTVADTLRWDAARDPAERREPMPPERERDLLAAVAA